MKRILLLCCLFAATSVFAQGYYPLQSYGLRKDTMRLELFGGLALPGDHWRWTTGGNRAIDPGPGGGAVAAPTTHELGSTGWTAGVGFIRNVFPALGVGLDANYTQFGDGKKSGGDFYRTGLATGLIVGRVTMFPSSAVRPYVPFGLGLGYTLARKELAAGGHTSMDGTGLAEMIGLGLEFDIDDSMLFGVESRYYNIHTASDVKDTTGRGHFQHLLVMLKMGFRF